MTRSKKKDKKLESETIDDVRQGFGAGAYEALKPKNAMFMDGLVEDVGLKHNQFSQFNKFNKR